MNAQRGHRPVYLGLASMSFTVAFLTTVPLFNFTAEAYTDFCDTYTLACSATTTPVPCIDTAGICVMVAGNTSNIFYAKCDQASNIIDCDGSDLPAFYMIATAVKDWRNCRNISSKSRTACADTCQDCSNINLFNDSSCAATSKCSKSVRTTRRCANFTVCR
ncbi:hypothetical protein [Singulisphaera sp. PoT]|uniref:hypothetical protein n=1 Tax=Singulisphaera sp. PoT TaxID=3411797 RepID=UPI003BF5FDB0